MTLQHRLDCPGAVISVVTGLTFALVTCRGCHAEIRVPR